MRWVLVEPEDGVRPEWLMDLTVEMNVFDSIYRTRSGRLVRDPADSFRGRHAVFLLGLTSDDELVFRNSWGQEWGDEGLGYISRLYFEQNVNAVWLKRPSWIGWSPGMADALDELARKEGSPPSPSDAAVAKAWVTPNRSMAKEAIVNGSQCRFRVRQVLGSTSETPLIDVIQVATEDTRLGRAHLEMGVSASHRTGK